MPFNTENAVFGSEFDPSGIVKGANAIVDALKKTASTQEQVNTAMQEGQAINDQYAGSAKKVNDALKTVSDTQKKVVDQMGKPIAPTIDLSAMNKVTVNLNKFKESFKGKLNLALDTSSLDILNKKIIEAKSNGGFKDIASIVETLGQKLIELEPGTQEFNDLSKAVAAGNIVLKEYQTLLNQATQETQENATQTKSLRTRIKEYREELTRLEDAGQEETEQYRQTQLAAAKLTDQYGDMQQQIRILASDTRNLDFAVGVIQAAGAGFQAVAGGLELFGVSSDDAQKAQAKLLAIMSLVQGVQQLQNLLLKESVIRTVGADLATKAFAASQRLLAITLGVSAAASKTLQAALITTGVGALVVALGFLIAKIVEWSDASDKATRTQDALNYALEQQQKLFDEDIKSIEASGEMRKIRLQQKNADERKIYESGQQDLLAVQKASFARVGEIYKLVDAFNKQRTDESDKEFAKRLKTAQEENGYLFNLEKERAQRDQGAFEATAQYYKNIETERLRAINKEREDQKLYRKLRTDVQKQDLNERGKQLFDLRFNYEEQRKDIIHNHQKTTDLDKQYQVQRRALLSKFKKEDYVEQTRVDDELDKLQIEAGAKRIANIQDEFDRRKEEIKNGADSEREALTSAQIAFTEKLQEDLQEGIITPEAYQKSMKSLNDFYDKLFEQVGAKVIIETAKLNADIFQKLISDLQRQAGFAITNISTVATAEIVNLSMAYTKGTITYAKYQRELTAIMTRESKQRLNVTKSELEEAISKVNGRLGGKLSKEERKALEDQRNELLGQLSSTNRELATLDADNKKKQEDLDKAAFQRKIDSYQAFAKTVVSILNSVADADQRNLDRSIAYQEKRVAYAQQIAENGNAEYLELEQKRLDELQRRREQSAEKQLAINNALVASEALVAVISAIAANAGTGFGVFAVLPAIFGAIAAGYSFVSSLDPQPVSNFWEGTRYVDGPGGRDQVPAMLTQGEGVMPVEQNRKYSKALDAIYNQSIPAEAMNQFASLYPDVPMVNYDRLGGAMDIVVATSLSKNNETLERIAMLLEEQEPVQVNSSMDADGFSLAITKFNRKSKLRGRA